MSDATILIIENDFSNAKLFQDALLAYSPAYESRIAPSLEIALAYLRAPSAKYDFILLDLGLEDASSLEGLKVLKQEFPHIPVGIITGNDDSAQRRRALKRVGAVFYVLKPFGNPKILHSLVEDAHDIYYCQVEIWRGIHKMQFNAELNNRFAELEAGVDAKVNGAVEIEIARREALRKMRWKKLFAKWKWVAGVVSAVVGAALAVWAFGKEIVQALFGR